MGYLGKPVISRIYLSCQEFRLDGSEQATGGRRLLWTLGDHHNRLRQPSLLQTLARPGWRALNGAVLSEAGLGGPLCLDLALKTSWVISSDFHLTALLPG